MSIPARCPQCGAPLAPGSPDAPCPACLMQLGLENWRASQLGKSTEAIVGHGADDSQRGRPLLPPDELARYFPELEIIRLLGRGGMGAVYQARQRELDRLVALKIILPDVAAERGFAERFTREARVLARLNHSNIVTIHDFGRREGLFFLVMEFVDGINLRELIRDKKLSAEQALTIVPILCEALQFAHNEGVVHRDIKPENILLDRKGRIKIADFGLAKLLGDQAPDYSLTGTRQVVGTPQYMAPEQMQGSGGVDHRADIYSLGVVFYEMLTGELPVGRFAPPSHHVVVDIRLDEVVLRSLERDRERRYQRVSDIKTAVETIAEDRGVESDSVRRDSSAIESQNDSHLPLSSLGWVWKRSRRLSRRSKIGFAVVLGLAFVLWCCGFSSAAQHRLVTAAQNGETSILASFLLFGVSPNSRLSNSDSALLRASGTGQRRCVEMLLDYGATIDDSNSSGITPLMFAAWQGQDEIVDLLLSRRANPTKLCLERESALHKAAFQGRLSIAQKLIAAGAMLDDGDNDGETALILAAAQGHRSTVRMLLEKGASPNASTRAGTTPLMAAASNGHLSVVNELLQINHHLNDNQLTALDAKSDSALNYAVANGHEGVINRLFEAGAKQTSAALLWAGFRAAQNGNYAKSISLIEEASFQASPTSQRRFAANGWTYEVRLSQGFVNLVIGMCQTRLKQLDQARASFDAVLQDVDQGRNSIVILTRTKSSTGNKSVETFRLTSDEIRRHLQTPDSNWQFQVSYGYNQWTQSSNSSQSGETTLNLADLFH